MLCDKCGQREATVHVTRIVNGKKEKLHLCDECAAQEGLFAWSFEPQFPLHGMLKGLLNDVSSGVNAEISAGDQIRKSPGSKVCPNCGRSYREFARTGFLGCAECYEAFGELIKPLLRRMHGAVVHRGRGPGSAGGFGEHEKNRAQELSRLKRELQQAVEVENYERAAQIRDAIERLEGDGDD